MLCLVAAVMAGLVSATGAANHAARGVPSEGVIRLLSPGAGDVFTVGGEMTIRWVVNPRRLAAGVGVYFSPDAGRQWQMIADGVLKTDDPSFYLRDTGTYH